MQMQKSSERVNSKRQLAINTVWNLLGNGLPLLAAFLSIPVLIKSLGTDRFGVLALVWTVIGYFSFFDLGIGRATTKFVAEYISAGDPDAIPPIFWTSIAILTCVGVLIGFVTIGITPRLVNQILKIPNELKPEMGSTLSVLALSLPVVLIATATRGVLEGLSLFNVVNAIKIPTNLALVLAPLMVLPFSRELYPIVSVLVASRAVSLGFYFYYCLKTLPILRRIYWPTIERTKKLISFGGWLTITNVVGSLISMGYIDRVLISSLLAVSSVTYYVTPFELISKLWIFPYSLMAVFFPVFTACTVTDRGQLPDLHRSAITYVLLVLAPVVVTVIVLARPFLQFWLGDDIASRSTVVLQLLSIGVFTNALAQVPFTIIQSMGRPDLTAKRHLWELPFYIVIMWYCVRALGIIGAAITWLTWSVLDMVILLWIARKLLLQIDGSFLPKNSRFIAFLFVALQALAYYVSNWSNLVLRIALLMAILTGMTVFSWNWIMDSSDKAYLKKAIRGSI